MKTLARAFREVIEIADPSDSNLTEDDAIVKMLCYWGRQSCDELDKISRQRDLLLKVVKGLMEEADDGSARFDDPAPGSIFIKAKAAIAEVEK